MQDRSKFKTLISLKNRKGARALLLRAKNEGLWKQNESGDLTRSLLLSEVFDWIRNGS